MRGRQGALRHGLQRAGFAERLGAPVEGTHPQSLSGNIMRDCIAFAPASKAHQKSGPFPSPELPGLTGRTTLSRLPPSPPPRPWDSLNDTSV